MAPGSRSSSRLSQPLPMIIEDVVHSTTPPPGVPPKSPRRPPVSRSNSQGSLHSSHRSRTPPPFGVGPVVPGVGGGGGARPASISSTTAAGTTNKAEVTQQGTTAGGERRDQGPVARKGWYRTMLGSLLVVGVIVGLSVGLTIGLRKRNQQSQSEPDTSNLFPAGSYTFTTALLSNISTSCLSIPSFQTAWQCYTSPPPPQPPPPSDPPQHQTQATFHWTISPSPRNTYTISTSPPSSSNKSEPQFQNLTLTTLDINQYTERLSFSFIYPKPVSLSIPLSNNSTEEEQQIKCWFNTTVLTATIWTRRPTQWPEGVVKGVNITEITQIEGKEGEERVWPFLVEVGERQLGLGEGEEEGGMMPDCYDERGVGVDLGVLIRERNNDTASGDASGGDGDGEGEGECGCWYQNFDLDGTEAGRQQQMSNGTVTEKLRRGR
ncbi:hypothetical protein B0T21DRAFT_406369 [Apiosordaria backusii]|uniref:Uncharacterized protein n=1 Tax=Apiosordaria backusii TaxID=314023 RepID=A0AA40K738_9PEZI|nr:hypothetical protein B0T21DRAFT_406369 [Apiosordaria backusii]